jgi:hypothetical protein
MRSQEDNCVVNSLGYLCPSLMLAKDLPDFADND